MLYVPVVSNTGKPLMPCHPARAMELVRKGRAVRRFNRGMFYIRLLDMAEGDVQPVACGIDPGSKKEGLTVESSTLARSMSIFQRPANQVPTSNSHGDAYNENNLDQLI